MSEYVTIKEIARRASISEKTARKFIRRGEIPHYRPHPKGKMLIRWSDFEAWIESRRVRIERDTDARELLEILFSPVTLPKKRSA
jgi:excisionase family DNA binding protein